MDILVLGSYVRVDRVFWEIDDREYFKYETKSTGSGAEFSSLAAGASTDYIQIVNLEPRENIKLLQYLEWATRTGAKYFLRRPAGTDRFGTDKQPGSGFLTAEDSHPTAYNPDYGFWMMARESLAIKCENNTKFTMTPKVEFQGIKYKIATVVNTNILKGLNKGEIEFRIIPRGVAAS